MKKIIPLILILLLTLSLVTGCGTSKESGAKVQSGITAKEIRVATQPIPHFAPIFVAKQKGWLEEDLKKVGVTIKWTSFNAGPPMNESFAAGQQDIGFMGDSPAIIAKAAGQNTRIVGLSTVGPKGLALVVAKESTLNSAKDLKGKKIGVVKGSYAHHLLFLVLKNNGLTTDDIQIVNLTLADIGTVLAKGDIDAGAIWEPLITKLDDKGEARVLIDGTGIKKGILVIGATDDFATKNPELVKIFLKAYQRGNEFIKANPQEAANLIVDDVKLSPEQLAKVLVKFDFNPSLNANDIEELKASEEFMRNVGITKTKVDVDAFVDTGYLRGAGIQN